MVKELNVIEKIKNTAALIIPENGSVLLYGSRARGEAHEDSDWDILILLEKDHISKEDYDNVVYPFYKLGVGNECYDKSHYLYQERMEK